MASNNGCNGCNGPQVRSVESKMASLPNTLHYSSRDAYITGLDDILAKPTLTM